MIFSFTCCGSDEKSEKPVSDNKKVETNNNTSMTESDDKKIENKLSEYVKKYLNIKIDDITVNPDLGTEKMMIMFY